MRILKERFVGVVTTLPSRSHPTDPIEGLDSSSGLRSTLRTSPGQLFVGPSTRFVFQLFTQRFFPPRGKNARHSSRCHRQEKCKLSSHPTSAGLGFGRQD